MESVAAVFEVLGWAGLAAAVLFGLIALVLRMVRGAWESAPAVRVDDEIRWMDSSGDFHTSSAAAHPLVNDDDAVVFYRTGRPETWYPEKVAHDERSLRLIALCLAAVAAVAFVVSLLAQLA